MDPWSNIEIPPDDPEILQIDKFKASIGKIPPHVYQIRKLISGFEICHYKFDQHLGYIKGSISNLKPNIILEDIGRNHLRNGEKVIEKDRSGRSFTGYIYVLLLGKWLGESDKEYDVNKHKELANNISRWLGQKDAEKERLVRLLIARLKWDWKAYESLLRENANKDLENQVCRIDICHYNFPKIINSVLIGIGQLKPVDLFEGCGSFTSDIKSSVEGELDSLTDIIKDKFAWKEPDKKTMIRIWLYFCLAKTLKEQVGIKRSLGSLFKIKT